MVSGPSQPPETAPQKPNGIVLGAVAVGPAKAIELIKAQPFAALAVTIPTHLGSVVMNVKPFFDRGFALLGAFFEGPDEAIDFVKERGVGRLDVEQRTEEGVVKLSLGPAFPHPR